jgi:hypothetical protein
MECDNGHVPNRTAHAERTRLDERKEIDPMRTTPLIISLICLSTFGAFAGTAQTLTSTFQFTGSGLIGTPATVSTPFNGQTFTNAAITVTAIANTANRQLDGPSCPWIPNDSASIVISGIGTFQAASTTITSCTIVDPVKGVVADDIYFTNGPSFMGATGFGLAFNTSTGWNMLTSYGPVQMQINGGSGAIVTNGGSLVLSSSNPNGAYQGTFQATLTGTPPPPTLTRTGALSHIAAGGGWTTVITLVNNSSKALPVTVALHGDDGSALSLPVTTTQQDVSQKNSTSSVSATINPYATLLISTGDQVASTIIGWADVLSTGSLGGYAIFRSTPQTGSPSEGTVPLQSQFPSTVTLPYDNTAGFVMGVALANLSASFASVTVTMWDDSGNQLGTQFTTIAGNGHTAFVLPNQFPLMAGKRGIVRFQAAGVITGLGLRFSPFGTFTSVPTM